MSGNPSSSDSAQEDDVQDDAIIASALRASLIGLMLLGIPVIGVLIYLNVSKSREEATETEVTLPTVRQLDSASLPGLKMVNVTQQSGVDFMHHTGRAGEKLLPETMGSGVAVFDYNGDSHLDLLFVDSTLWPWAILNSDESGGDEAAAQSGQCKLYQGDGQFGFVDVSQSSGLDASLYGMGAAVGDYDNDGDVDVFVSAVGQNRLYRNENGKFTDVTSDAGVAGDESAWSTSCGFFDYDNDGLLDLFVSNYVTWNREADVSQNFTLDGQSRAYGPPRAFAGSYSYLYHNVGDGKFSDVSQAAGIQVRNDDTDVPLGKGMGLSPVDYNGDGWIDICVANDTVRNFLFENQRDGTFREVSQLTGIAFDRATGNARGAMGIDSAQFRQDGTLAIGIGNFANEPSALYMSKPGRDQFIDAAMFTGFGPPTRQGLTFGLFFFDVDLDGRLDVFGANGHLEDEIAKTQVTQKYAQSPQLFWNAGKDAKSELVLVDSGCVGESFCEPIVGRGAAYGDFDADGDQDVVITTSGSKPAIFRNDQATGHHFIRFNLEGTSANRSAIGATIELEVGGQKMARTVMPTRSYLSQSESTVTFGLGSSESVRNVSVTWPGSGGSPSSVRQAVDVGAVDQTVFVRQQ